MNKIDQFFKCYNFDYIGIKKEKWDQLYHAIKRGGNYVRVDKEIALEILKRLDLVN